MTTFTDKEMQLLENIAHDEVTTCNGATPTKADETSAYLWADDRAKALGITGQAIGGLLTSLQTKGAIGVSAACREDPDGGVWFTEAGLAAWMAQRSEPVEAEPISPVSTIDVLGAMLRGEFKEMTLLDLDSFAGIEYDGYIAEINGCLAVVDYGLGDILVQVCTEDGNGVTYQLKLGGELVAI